MIKWGVEEYFRTTLEKSFVNNVYAISEKEFIASSRLKTYLFNHNSIIGSVSKRITSAVYSNEFHCVICATHGVGNIIALDINSFHEPFLCDISTNQPIISQLYISQKNRFLFTVGINIKIWKITLEITAIDRKVKLQFINEIPISKISLKLDKVFFDEKQTRIFIPEINGYSLYTFSGNHITTCNTLSLNKMITGSVLFSSRKNYNSDMNQGNTINVFKKFIGCDTKGNVNLWHKSGTLIKTLSLTKGIISYIDFINSENILTIDHNGEIRITNIKTEKGALVLKFNEPIETSQLFQKGFPILSIVLGNFVSFYKINTLWSVWINNIYSTKMITRYFSPLNPIRIGVLSTHGRFILCSQIDGDMVLSIQEEKEEPIIQVCYDRFYQESVIFTLHSDNSVSQYIKDNYGVRKSNTLSFKSAILILVKAFEDCRWTLCSCNFFGDIILYDTITMAQLSRIHIDNYPITNIFWDKKNDHLITISSFNIMIFHLKHQRVICYHQVDHPSLSDYDNGTLAIFDDTGFISIFCISESSICIINQMKTPSPVQSISLSYGYHVLVLKNNNIVIGDKNNMSLLLISFPFDIQYCSFLNSDLDMIIASGQEIMKISNFELRGKLFSKSTKPDLISSISSVSKINFEESPVEHDIPRNNKNNRQGSLTNSEETSRRIQRELAILEEYEASLTNIRIEYMNRRKRNSFKQIEPTKPAQNTIQSTVAPVEELIQGLFKKKTVFASYISPKVLIKNDINSSIIEDNKMPIICTKTKETNKKNGIKKYHSMGSQVFKSNFFTEPLPVRKDEESILKSVSESHEKPKIIIPIQNKQKRIKATNSVYSIFPKNPSPGLINNTPNKLKHFGSFKKLSVINFPSIIEPLSNENPNSLELKEKPKNDLAIHINRTEKSIPKNHFHDSDDKLISNSSILVDENNSIHTGTGDNSSPPIPDMNGIKDIAIHLPNENITKSPRRKKKSRETGFSINESCTNTPKAPIASHSGPKRLRNHISSKKIDQKETFSFMESLILPQTHEINLKNEETPKFRNILMNDSINENNIASDNIMTYINIPKSNNIIQMNEMHIKLFENQTDTGNEFHFENNILKENNNHFDDPFPTKRRYLITKSKLRLASPSENRSNQTNSSSTKCLNCFNEGNDHHPLYKKIQIMKEITNTRSIWTSPNTKRKEKV